MNVTRKEQRIIQRALNAWQASGELTPSDSQRLAQTMRVSPFDWRRLSRYAFWTALACVLISLGSLFADSELVAWLLSLFSHSALTRILLPRPLLGYGAKALVAGVAGAAVGLLSAVLTALIALVTGLRSPGAEVLHLLVSVPVAGALLAALGLAVGQLVPSTTAAVGVVLGWWFLVEAIALPAVPFGRAVAAWLPATSAQFATIGVPAHTVTWSPWVSLAILAAWTAAATSVAAWNTARS